MSTYGNPTIDYVHMCQFVAGELKHQQFLMSGAVSRMRMRKVRVRVRVRVRVSRAVARVQKGSQRHAGCM